MEKKETVVTKYSACLLNLFFHRW